MENIAAGDIAVMSELVDFQPLSWNPTDAQMVEARQLSLVDVANLFNIDPYWVGSSQVSAPYQNVQDAAVQLSRFTLNFWITALEEEFSRFLVARHARQVQPGHDLARPADGADRERCGRRGSGADHRG